MKIMTIFLLLTLGFVTTAPAQSKLSFATADDQTHGRSKAMNAVLKECFKRMHIEIRINSVPSKRSLLLANGGIEDGNFVRTAGISEAYPNLIKVPEKIAVNHIVAFSKDKGIKVDGWKSLLQYHVAYINGWRNCERELRTPKAKTTVKNEELLFTLLEKGRAEVGIFGRSTGVEVLKKLGYADIHPLAPPVAVSDLFLYVNKKHEPLISKIVETLKQMKEDGTYENLVRAAFPEKEYEREWRPK